MEAYLYPHMHIASVTGVGKLRTFTHFLVVVSAVFNELVVLKDLTCFDS